MWISFYNKEGIADTLLLSSGTANRYDVEIKKNKQVTQVLRVSDGKVVGYNIENISKQMIIDQTGPVVLDSAQQEVVAQLIAEAGFSLEAKELQVEPTLVVGYVEACVPHEDSDHLSVTQTRVSQTEVLQIVCGAANVREGQKVVVAKPGTVMPNGAVIWEGELRGVKSQGMLCSARELQLPEATPKKGILVLEDTAVVGEPFVL